MPTKTPPLRLAKPVSREQVREVVKGMFTNGFGHEASYLVLAKYEHPDIVWSDAAANLGRWSKEAMEDFICSQLNIK